VDTNQDSRPCYIHSVFAVADLLDKSGQKPVFKARLFRESCVLYRGQYIKDLNKLGRSLHRIIIIDNSPICYFFHPDNAVPVRSWFDDPSDSELLHLIPFFERLAKVDNVVNVLRNSKGQFNSYQSLENRLEVLTPYKTSK